MNDPSIGEPLAYMMWRDHGEPLAYIIYATGQWAVTEFGIENVRGPCLYSIAWNDLIPSRNWVDHMGCKNWVHMPSFEAVYKTAMEMKASHLQPRTLSDLSKRMSGDDA